MRNNERKKKTIHSFSTCGSCKVPYSSTVKAGQSEVGNSEFAGQSERQQIGCAQAKNRWKE